MVVQRRTLALGADYEIDRASGRVLLAAPLGWSSPADTVRSGALANGWRPRLVVDYAHAPAPGEASSHDGAARVYVEAGQVMTAGLRGALSSGGDDVAGLIGADVSAHPLPFVALSASAAHSAGYSSAPPVSPTPVCLATPQVREHRGGPKRDGSAVGLNRLEGVLAGERGVATCHERTVVALAGGRLVREAGRYRAEPQERHDCQQPFHNGTHGSRPRGRGELCSGPGSKRLYSGRSYPWASHLGTSP